MQHIAIYCTYTWHIHNADKFQHQNKEKSPYQYTYANSFQGTIPKFTWAHSFRLLSVETLKTLVCSGLLESEGYFTNTFLCLSEHLQLTHLWKCAKGHDQTWPCMHLLRYGTFEHLLWYVTWCTRTQQSLNWLYG